MANVSIKFNNKDYLLSCDDGQEESLKSLTKFLDKKLLLLFIAQWILNVSWNYFFFNQQLTVVGLVSITLLWLLIGYFTFEHLKKLRVFTLLILPYLIWMTIATSLNAYIVFYN